MNPTGLGPALRTGTVSAAEVLEHTRPAAVAVTVAVCEEGGIARPGERRAADDARVLLARYAVDRLADDPDRWARVIAGVNTFAGTVPELLADPRIGDEPEPAAPHGPSMLTTVNAANILLALAPRAVAAKSMEDTVTEATSATPLCRALVEHVVTRGSCAQRERLAANEARRLIRSSCACWRASPAGGSSKRS